MLKLSVVMNPQENQPNPIDYLDQISPTAPKRKLFNLSGPKLLGAIGLGVILLICAVFITISTVNGSKTTEKLAARLVVIEEIAKDSTSKIKSSRLRAINSELKTFLTNTIRDIEPLLATENTKIKNLPKSLLNATSDTNLKSRLEDARLNAVFDRTYTREMAYELSNIQILMQNINKNTNNKNFKSFLSDSYMNLTPIQKQFADFESTDH